jgi:hypothetical protein
MVGRVDGARRQLICRRIRAALLVAIAASSACSRSDARTSSVSPHDTLHTAEESLRRFRERLIRVDSLWPAFTTKEDLARAFVTAVAERDIRRLAPTLLTRAEFAWLYYPENPISRPPYELPAGIAWFELEGNSMTGVRRALASYGGRTTVFRGVSCDAHPLVQGPNRLWNRCTLALTLEDGTAASVRMFGSILERAGRFKLVSAANDL